MKAACVATYAWPSRHSKQACMQDLLLHGLVDVEISQLQAWAFSPGILTDNGPENCTLRSREGKRYLSVNVQALMERFRHPMPQAVQISTAACCQSRLVTRSRCLAGRRSIRHVQSHEAVWGRSATSRRSSTKVAYQAIVVVVDGCEGAKRKESGHLLDAPSRFEANYRV